MSDNKVFKAIGVGEDLHAHIKKLAEKEHRKVEGFLRSKFKLKK